MAKKILIYGNLILAVLLVVGAVQYFSGQQGAKDQSAPKTIVLEETIPPTIEKVEQAAAEAAEAEEEQEQEAEEVAAPVVSENASAHLCYMSFNNPHEVSVARTFSRSLAHYKEAPRIRVTEYQSDGADPEEAFEQLAKSGTRCDGLVLSGHHDEDGEFWGDRTSGDMEIDFLNELAANPRLSNWFANIKALWLQGCHTATTQIFNKDVKSKYRISGSPIGMINKHLDFDEIEDSIDDLYDIFLENTEEDNIILDYGRVFPSATIYTWWDLAPGVEAGSHWSLPFHIVQTSYIIDSDPKYFQHPFKTPIPKDAALRYAEILYEGMTRPAWPGKHEGPLQADEDMLIKGWKEHGLWAIHKREYSFENASAVGHRSLLSSNSGLLKQLRGFTMLLEQFDEEWLEKSPSAVVNKILRHEDYIPYNVHLLWAFAQRSPALKNNMASSEPLATHLQWLMTNAGDGSLKRDAKRFYNYLHPET